MKPIEPSELPSHAEVIVEAPRFSWSKRRDDGSIDFLSPVPCPFNYGSVPGTVSGDGDRIDALVLGPRLPRHSRHTLPVLGVVRFVDAGDDDPKWICGEQRLDDAQRLMLETFFQVYAVAKGTLNRLRGRGGPTRFDGIWLR
jgi:inorganic pyrophosphatase